MNRLFLLQLILWIACSLQVNVSLAQCADTNGNGVCDTDETGCTIESACNYDAEAVIEDNTTCDFLSCLAFGCTDEGACNFDAEATFEDGTCLYPSYPYDCDGNCISDENENGVCDPFETAGCTDEEACNFEVGATLDNGTCTYGCSGCLDPAACNYDPQALIDSGDCDFTSCIALGCTDEEACNFDPSANLEDGSCETLSCAGCTDASACNYDPAATLDDGSCTGPEAYLTCEGTCLNDADGDGICDPLEVLGCTESGACNYSPLATEDNGSCDYCSCGAETALVMSSNAAGYGVLLEVLASHEEGALAGYATYRLYLTTPHSDDVVSSVVGDDQFPLSIQTTGTFFQEPIFGGPTPANLLPGAVDMWPDLAWDSWVTVGIDGPAVSADGEVNITLLPGSWVDDFESGTGFVVDSPEGSGWYTLPPNAANGLAGPERRVLLAQLTTDGDISGSFRSQVFVHGDLETDVRVDIAFDSAIPEGAVCGCTDAAANNFNPFADVNDGSCLFDVLGCLNPLACNYDANASQDDGSCDFVSCLAFGCTDESACNFDAEADYDDGGCTYANFPYGCDGTCLNDADNDGVCDEFEVLGCTDPSACNYQSGATSNDGSCTYNCLGCTNSAACNYDPAALQDNGSCDFESCVSTGCTDPNACNFDPEAQFDDGSCLGIPEGACDCDGNLLDALGICGGDCETDENGNGVCDAVEVFGCTLSFACNFNPEATLDDGSCDFLSCIAFGCNDPLACNYDPEATFNDGSCTYASFPYDCEGQCVNDGDGDGVCDEFEVFGCTDPAACNFEEGATANDNSCTYDCLGCTNSAACNYDPAALIDDGSCDFESCLAAGCTDPQACNYDESAQFDDGSCIGVPEGNCDCGGNIADALGNCGGDCAEDADGNGVCDDDELEGCTSPLACNYDPEASMDNGTCDFVSCIAFGCNDPSACNYDPEAEFNDGSCTYATFPYDCEGQCVNDGDGDGVCDEFEVFGCTDPAACNFEEGATANDNSCIYDCLGCTNSAACNYDPAALIDDGSCDFESCVTLGCTDPSACNFDPEAEFDNGTCVAPDECGICYGPGAVYACGCTEVPETDCDCNGNQLDALGACGGTCEADVNGNGLCDIDETTGCTDSDALNYDVDATFDDGSCIPNVPGCLNPSACNYIPEATVSDGSCDFESCVGCTISSACNYNPEATLAANSTCTFPAASNLDCEGNCLIDIDSDGICDEDEVGGCTDEEALNYDAEATEDDGTCIEVVGGCLNSSACNFNPEANVNNGTCDFDSCVGCTLPEACNFNPDATVAANNTCTQPDETYLNCDGACMNDADEDGVCDELEVLGCTDPQALNFDSDATEDNGTCIGIVLGCVGPNACNFNPEANVSDGSCDYETCVGCTLPAACNYNAEATIAANGTCLFPLEDNLDCAGNCLNDADADGICDEDEIAGCTDPLAFNFDEEATDDDGSCLAVVPGCLQSNACNFNASANVSDGSCEFDSCAGCTLESACNFDPEAILQDNGTCEFPEEDYLSCDGLCLNDIDADGVCDEEEVLGCTNPDAQNFNPNATEDNGNCIVLVGGCLVPVACNYDPSADYDYNIPSACDFESCSGCTVPVACNYDPNASFPANSTCTFSPQFYDCDGNCNQDFDGDGVCNQLEVDGCTDPLAQNYDEEATDDDGSCNNLIGGCTLTFACNYDTEADYYLPGSCDFSCLGQMFLMLDCLDPFACNYGAAEPCVYFDENGDLCATVGCTDVNACNYDENALILDGSCDYTSCVGCTDQTACNYSLEALEDDGSCEFESCAGCINPEAVNYNPDATLDDGSCILPGCTILGACNYDVNAGFDDGSCDFLSCAGCTLEGACNFESDANISNNSLCTYPLEAYLDCAGECLNDSDADGVCDELEITGCTDPEAFNFDPDATDDDGNCEATVLGCLSNAACNFNPFANTSDGSCEFVSCAGCTLADACNYDPNATIAANSGCTYPEEDFLNCDGNCLNDGDLDGVCDEIEVEGCTDNQALNYDDEATDDDGTCILPVLGCLNPGACNFEETANVSDGSCEFETCIGCTLFEACNYDPLATIAANGTCTFPSEDYLDCAGTCLQDADNDGVCDEEEVLGCTDPMALNYNPNATEDNGQCTLPVEGCLNPGACNYNPLANTSNGSCEFETCAGCTLLEACNFDPFATISANTECTYPEEPYLGCDGSCLQDDDNDGVCDELEVLGCTDPEALNFNGSATENDGSCIDVILGCLNPSACNFNAAANTSDGSCDFDSCVGCTLEGACNYSPDFTVAANATCTYPASPLVDCDGNCVNDVDGDGLCDEIDECIGAFDACGVCNGLGEVSECGCSDIPAGDCDCDGNQLDVLGVCGGSCAADADADGLCDDVDDCVGAYDACGVCNGPGGIYECGCADIPEGDCDCNGNQLDALGVCGGSCAADADADGLCDDVDDCVGAYDACGICNGPGDIYECGCADIPEGDCDCDGNQLDALGVCGGDCAADEDGDGLCDDVDDCVGAYDSCGVCNGPGEIYECGCADIPEGDCDCDGNQLDVLGVCGGSCAADADADGLCDDVDDCVGAYDDCGVCNGPGGIYECGCADIPEGDCDCNGNQLDALGVCGGSCAADADADGLCDDVDDCVGAYDACGICNGPGDIYECGCADIPEGDCDCNGNQLDALGVCGGDCAADEDGDGLCDDVDNCVGAYDACGICNGLGEIYECGCSDIPEGDCDCDGNQLDALGVCGGSCAADADADGLCDDVDDCVGAYDACGICNGPGDIYECGCADIPEGDCDCDGNQLDVLGVCGGSCAADADADGLCDDVDDCVGAYDDCGVCNGPGGIYECGCADIPEGDCDCNGNQLDALGVCGGSCAADADADGLCDDVDDCVGAYDACGICNSPGDIYECGCADIPEGDCDCNGNQLDALGVCGGSCAADADADGLCDDVDDCVGAYDACGICNGPGDIYECGCADIPEGDCDCNGNQLDALGVCGGDCAADEDGDGLCDDVDNCVGAYDACGICNGLGEIYECGCSDIPEGDCDCDGNQLDALGVCGGECTADADGDGVCDDTDPWLGTVFTGAVGALWTDVGNWDNGLPAPGNHAEVPSGTSVIIPADIAVDCGCEVVNHGTITALGTLNNQEMLVNVGNLSILGQLFNSGQLDNLGGLVNSGSLDNSGSLNSEGTLTNEIDGMLTNSGEWINSGTVFNQGDLSSEGEFNNEGTFINEGGLNNEGVLINEGTLVNSGTLNNTNQFDNTLTVLNDGTIYTCAGIWSGNAPVGSGLFDANDVDNDGLCDSADNCFDLSACNFDDGMNSPCEFLDALGVCGGECAADADGDGICDEEQTEEGCTDVWACNYDIAAFDDDGTCEYESCLGCIYGSATNYDPEASLDDGSCIFAGCMDDEYVSYHPQANQEESGFCTNAPSSADINQDGLVQLEDLVMFLQAFRLEGPEWGDIGWLQQACNVPSYTQEEMWEALLDSLPEMPNFEDPTLGCSYPGAMNYDPQTTFDMGLCLFAGCTDPEAFNFDELATVDNGACNYEVCPDFDDNGEVQISDLMDFLLLWGN